MHKKRGKNKTIEGYFLGEEVFSSILLDEDEKCILSVEDVKFKASAFKTSKKYYAMVSGHGRAQKGF